MDITLQRIIELLELSPAGNKGLAEYLEIHPNIITNWKGGNNKSYRKRLPKIAEYFGVTVDYLLGKEKSTPAGDTGKSAEVLSEEDARIQRLVERFKSMDEKRRTALEHIMDVMDQE